MEIASAWWRFLEGSPRCESPYSWMGSRSAGLGLFFWKCGFFVLGERWIVVICSTSFLHFESERVLVNSLMGF